MAIKPLRKHMKDRMRYERDQIKVAKKLENGNRSETMVGFFVLNSFEKTIDRSCNYEVLSQTKKKTRYKHFGF